MFHLFRDDFAGAVCISGKFRFAVFKTISTRRAGTVPTGRLTVRHGPGSPGWGRDRHLWVRERRGDGRRWKRALWLMSIHVAVIWLMRGAPPTPSKPQQDREASLRMLRASSPRGRARTPARGGISKIAVQLKRPSFVMRGGLAQAGVPRLLRCYAHTFPGATTARVSSVLVFP